MQVSGSTANPATEEATPQALPAGRLRPARPPRAAWVALAVVVPWSWFLLRDLSVSAEAVASGLPVPVFAVGVAFLVLAARRHRVSFAAAGASWLLVGLAAVIGPWLPEPGSVPVQPLRLVLANIRDDNHRRDQGVTHVLAQGGDVVVLIEVEGRAESALSGSYPFITPVPGASKVVLSRYPTRLVEPATSFDGFRLARLEVQAPMGPVLLYVVHLPRPHARPDLLIGDLKAQRTALDTLLRAASSEQLPVLLVGDFNLSDRTGGYRELHRRYKDAIRSTLARPTYIKPILWPQLLRVDYIFMPRTWCSSGSRSFVIPGSDHRGISAEVGTCRTPPGIVDFRH